MLTQLTEQLYAFTIPNCKKIDKAVINHGNHTFLEVGYWTHEGSLGICAEALEGDWEVVWHGELDYDNEFSILTHGIDIDHLTHVAETLDLNIKDNHFIILEKIA